VQAYCLAAAWTRVALVEQHLRWHLRQHRLHPTTPNPGVMPPIVKTVLINPPLSLRLDEMRSLVRVHPDGLPGGVHRGARPAVYLLRSRQSLGSFQRHVNWEGDVGDTLPAGLPFTPWQNLHRWLVDPETGMLTIMTTLDVPLPRFLYVKRQ
jgi:hypothetical protein